VSHNLKPEGNPDFDRALLISLRYLQSRDRLQKEVENKLNEKDFSQEIIDQVINYLIQARFVNDERYVELFIESKSRIRGYGPHRLKQDLYRKGAPVELVDKYLSQMEPEDQLSKAIHLLQKKYTNGAPYEKAARYLYGKGYSSEVIKEAINQFFTSQVEL
jgi:regulatory protein